MSPASPQQPRTSRRYNWVIASIGFFLWGGWAFVVNRPSGLEIGARSGLAQGISSMLMTLIMIKAVTAISIRLSSRALKWTVPTIVTLGGTACILVLVHSLVGTPNILWTILPGLSGGIPMCLLTSYKLLPKAPKAAQPHESNEREGAGDSDRTATRSTSRLDSRNAR